MFAGRCCVSDQDTSDQHSMSSALLCALQGSQGHQPGQPRSPAQEDPRDTALQGQGTRSSLI